MTDHPAGLDARACLERCREIITALDYADDCDCDTHVAARELLAEIDRVLEAPAHQSCRNCADFNRELHGRRRMITRIEYESDHGSPYRRAVLQRDPMTGDYDVICYGSLDDAPPVNHQRAAYLNRAQAVARTWIMYGKEYGRANDGN
jgi:hypothetical protein